MRPVVVLVMLATQCAPLLREPFACDGVQLISRELTLAQAEAYCHYAVRERQKVAEYWGPTWTAPIRIHVSSEYRTVYLHTKLAGNPAFPNFGEDLKRLAARDLPGVETVQALNGVRTPRPLGTVLDEKVAYVVAGSFVGFLIERYGLPQFRSLYETESCETTYGKPFASLEGEWRSSLRE